MKTILTILITITLYSGAYAQLPNHNMHVIANKNDYPMPPQSGAPWSYAALWGYSAPDSREYAILGAGMGVVFYDVTDSFDVREVGYFPVPSTNFGMIWKEMKTFSHYAYVVSEAQNYGIEIYDLQYLPDSVVFVQRYIPPGHQSTHSISQSGPYLYINGSNSSFGDGTTVLDLSVDPEDPIVRGSWNNRYVHDSRIIDDTMYASCINDGFLSVIDVTDKDSLKLITEWINTPNPSTHNSALTKDKSHIMITDEVGPLPRLLKIWNIEDLEDPIQVTTWQPPGITTARVHNIEIYGDTAVIAHYTAGVYVLDISDPENPEEIAWYDTRPENNNGDFAGCWGVYMFPSGKVIASDMNKGLFVLGFGNSVGITNISNIAEGFDLSQNYPNPFNPSTEISFSIPRNSDVSLKVFDLGGKEVADLVNKKMEMGTYGVTFDAAKYGLSSGVYFYTLTAGDFKETKRMILVK